MASNGEKGFHVLIVLFLCIGIYNIMYDVEENNCEMTYMFEVPQYLKVFSFQHEKTSSINFYHNYSLYVYGEGVYFQNLLNQMPKLDGIPVLFIPGHGGSYKQVRSLGSVLLRKAMDKENHPHFNVFSVDLQDELVAFYGGTLAAQAEFVRQSIDYILSLYQHLKQPPTSVVLVGHSMGGIVARSVFNIPNFQHNHITTIITLASPHLAPVMKIDSHISNFYSVVNHYWESHNTSLSKVTVISVSGGLRDFHVLPAIARLPGNSSNHFSTISSAVPTVHVSADHQCIVWCKQLVLVTARFLFDIIDPKTMQVTNDVDLRSRAVNFHFFRNPGTGNFPVSGAPKKVKVSTRFSSIDVSTLMWSLNPVEAGTGTYFRFSVKYLVYIQASHFIARTNSKREKWILACKVTEESNCTEATDLSNLAAAALKYRVIHLNLSMLAEQGFSYILFPVSQAKAPKMLEVNVFSDLELSTKVTVPHVFSNLWTFGQGYRHTIAATSEKSRFYYRLELNEFQNIYQSFKLQLQSEKQHLMKLDVLWDEGHSLFGNNKLVVTLHNTAPSNAVDKVFVHIYLESDDQVIIKIKVEFFRVLGQIIRCLGVGLPVFVISNVIFTLGYQVRQMYHDQPCHSLAEAHSISSKPYKIQPFLSLFKTVYGMAWFYTVWTTFGVPLPDFVIQMDVQRTWFGFAPIIMFLFSFEIFTMMRLLQRWISCIIGKLMQSDKFAVFMTSSKAAFVKLTFHSVFLSISFHFASPFVFLYLYLVSFLHLCWLHILVKPYMPSTQSEQPDKLSKNGDFTALSSDENKNSEQPDKLSKDGDFAAPSSDDNTNSEQPDESSKETDFATTSSDKNKDKVIQPNPTSPSEDRYSVHFITTQLWLWLFLLSLPSFGALVTNFSWSFPDDPMFVEAVLASLIFILQSLKPSHDGIKTSKLWFLFWFNFPAAVFLVLLSMHSLYRAAWFIIFTLSWHTLTQFI